MGVEVLLAGLACLLYGAAGVLALAPAREPGQRSGQGAMVTAVTATLCLTGGLVLRGVSTGRFPAFGGFEAAAWYAGAVTLASVYASLRHGVLGTLSAVLFPYLALIVVIGLAWPPVAPPPELQLRTWQVGLHVSAAFLGYGLFTVESLLAAAYLVQDRALKRKRVSRLARRLPSLEALDRVMKELIGPAFALFTVSIGMGAVLARVNGWGLRWLGDTKVMATGAAWVIYGVLLTLRQPARRHGRGLACVALVGFACILVAFLGVHLLGDSVHRFGFSFP